MRTWTLIVLLMAAGCSRNIEVADDSGIGDGDDTGVSTNNDDTGNNVEDSGEVIGDVDCDANYSTPAPLGGDGDDACLTSTLVCGDVVEHTTEGGTTIADKDQYDTVDVWSCNPGQVGTGQDWSAAERFYEFEVPGNRTATLTMYYDCASGPDAWMRAVRSNDACPVEYSKNCTLPTVRDGKQEIQLTNVRDDPARYEVVVDGLDGWEGNFKLEVSCN